MSFETKKFFRLDVGLQEQYINRVWNYRNEEDAIATVVASGYFSDDHGIQVNDLIYAVASDDKQLLVVDSLDPITTSDFVGGGGSIPDGSITKAKLAADVATIVGIATHTLVVASSDTVTVTGALETDVVWAILTEAGSGIDHSIVGAAVTSADTVTLYSEDTFEALSCVVIVMRPGT
jgi:hypothetical protein